LAQGADENKSTNRGNTALHIASLAGKLDVVQLLLEAKECFHFIKSRLSLHNLYMETIPWET